MMKDENLAAEAAFIPAERLTDPPAWEEIESGRYQPRRIRGSYRGRVLG